MRDRVLMVLSFLAIHIVWGSTYLAIRYAVETIPPLLTAGLRHVIGGSILFAWCWSRGYRPTLAQWRASSILGVLFFLIGHGALHWAELFVPTGIAALLVATEVVWVAAMFAIVDRRTRMSPAMMTGLALGLLAVAILVDQPSSMQSSTFIGSVVIVIGAISWAAGVVYSRNASLHPNAIMSAAMTLLCGGMWLIGSSLFFGTLDNFHFANVSPRSALALSYLIVFGSLTFGAYSWLLRRCNPVLVAMHAYTNPILAVILGALIAGERVTPRVIVASVAVVAAILLVRRGDEASESVVLASTTE